MKTYKGMSTASPAYKKIQKETMENLWKAFMPEQPEQLELELGIFNLKGGNTNGTNAS
jgi:hypothetical protein